MTDKKLTFWKYLLINNIAIVIGLNVVAGAFIWFWWKYQGDAAIDTWLTSALVAAVNFVIVGVGYIKWKRSGK
jgi:hypothetical protein